VWTEPLEFGKLTWPEVARAAGEGRVPIVPIGTLEDHGHHLPIDTDVTLVEAVCRGAAEHLPAQTVLLPPIVHGYSPHHMDFPGPSRSAGIPPAATAPTSPCHLYATASTGC
jgi:creatinine amidohydrolase